MNSMKTSVWLITFLIAISPSINIAATIQRKSNQIKTQGGEYYRSHILKIVDEVHTKPVRRKRNIENAAHAEVIAVSVTSSVAVNGGRQTRSRKNKTLRRRQRPNNNSSVHTERSNTEHATLLTAASQKKPVTVAIPPSLEGANPEYIKQKMEKARIGDRRRDGNMHPFQISLQANKSKIREEDGSVPLARSISQGSKNNNYHVNAKEDMKQDVDSKPSYTHNVKIIHDLKTGKINENEPNSTATFSEPAKVYSEPAKNYGEPAQIYGKPEIYYSEPAKVYSEPARFYSEPAKNYGEPAKIYSEPSKIYSEPAKNYGEPSKFYSKPASLYLDDPVKDENETKHPETTSIKSLISAGTIEEVSLTTLSSLQKEHSPEVNYEIDEAINVMTNGKEYGVRETTTESSKVGYVVEGKNYRKYRVEERTSEGFIVGEFGVVNNSDGHLRGVRYTAEGDTNPRLIYDALLKFLSLQ